MKNLTKLWPYLRPYKVKLTWVFLLGLIMNAAFGRNIMIAKKLMDDGFAKQDLHLLSMLCLQIIGLMIIYAIARYFHLYNLKLTAERVSVQIQKDLQSKYMSLSLNYHSGSDSGGHISKVLNDVGNLQFGMTIFADLLREPFLILFCLGTLFYLDWRLTTALFLLLPFVILLKQVGRSVRKYSYSQQESLEKFTSTLKETLDGLRVIQSFNLETEMRSRLQRVVDVYLHARSKIISRQEGSGPVTNLVAAFMFSGAAYYMGTRISAGTATSGDFIGIITALGMIGNPINKIQDAYVRVQPTIASIDRIFSVLENQQVVPQPANPRAFPTSWESIEFRGVQFRYGNNTVLKEVDLTVKKGEVIALVGESGSGKSTLVNLLERFIDPTSGEVFIGNVPLKEIDLTDLRSNISLVTQDVFLFNDSIARNIQAGNFSREIISVESAAALANASDFIEKKPQKLQSSVGDRGGLLSGGEKQRISIARAMYKNAPILILDEATSALDSASEVEVQKGLDRLMEGRTTFVIAHRLSTVLKADRILVLRDGEIIEDGTHQRLMEQKGRYFEFFQLQTNQSVT